MRKNIVVISSSLHACSNSETLAKEFARGAEDAGNRVEFISLRGKKLAFCVGCFSCQKNGECVIKDDAVWIADKVLEADVVVFASPIYYYEMSGQLKTLIGRMNCLFAKDYKFRDVYFLSTAAEDEAAVPSRALAGIEGWADCFEKASVKGSLFCGGVTDGGEIIGSTRLNDAYNMGMNV